MTRDKVFVITYNHYRGEKLVSENTFENVMWSKEEALNYINYRRGLLNELHTIIGATMTVLDENGSYQVGLPGREPSKYIFRITEVFNDEITVNLFPALDPSSEQRIVSYQLDLAEKEYEQLWRISQDSNKDAGDTIRELIAQEWNRKVGLI